MEAGTMLRTLEERVDPKHSAVIVIDVQNYFCHPDGAVAKPGNGRSPLTLVAPRIADLVDAARSVGALVIWVQLTHSDETTSEPRWEQWRRHGAHLTSDDLHCRAGSWDWEFYVVSPQPGEPIVPKQRYSSFIGTNLDLILRSRRIRSLIVTGVSSHVCVESTIRDGFMLDYYITMVSDCTASADVERHEAAVRVVESTFGVVCTAEDIKNVWSRVQSPVSVGD
jgi:nicotinamidase-related amidase